MRSLIRRLLYRLTGGKIHYLIPLGVFLVLAVLLYWGLYQDPTEVPSPLVGKPAPEFQLESLLEPGKMISSDILKGKVSLVNVWASWCPSCRQEHQNLMQIAGGADVQMIGFNWRDPGDNGDADRGKALGFLRRFGDPYDVILYDPRNEAGIDWGVYGAPETFIVDPDGIIRHKRIGPIDAQVWRDEILPVIRQYQPKG